MKKIIKEKGKRLLAAFLSLLTVIGFIPDDGFCFYTIGGTDRILLLWRLLCQRGRKLLLFRKFIQFSGV